MSERKAATSPSGGWRQNGRKRKRGKQGDLLGSTRCSWPQGPKSRPAGVRAPVVARKRLTSVEPRDVGKWKDEEQNNGRQTNASARKGYAVAGAWPSAIDSESTERLADILMRGTICPHLAEKPLTGKPDAGDPPVRFGGRGGAKAPSLPLSKRVCRMFTTAWIWRAAHQGCIKLGCRATLCPSLWSSTLSDSAHSQTKWKTK